MNMLSVAPGKFTEPVALSFALSTMARTLVDVFVTGLKTTVRSRLGLSTIMPALVVVPDKETLNGLKTSLVASAIFSPGKIDPLIVGFSGFEMNARNLSPLVVVLELEPHELSPPISNMETKRALKVLFNPGTPRALQDRELDAKRGL